MFNKKAKKEEKNPTFSANKVFGISDKRADEIIKAFRHGKIENENWVGVLEYVKKECKLKGEAEFAYFGYMFGRMYEQHQNPISHLMEHLMSH